MLAEGGFMFDKRSTWYCTRLTSTSGGGLGSLGLLDLGGLGGGLGGRLLLGGSLLVLDLGRANSLSLLLDLPTRTESRIMIRIHR